MLISLTVGLVTITLRIAGLIDSTQFWVGTAVQWIFIWLQTRAIKEERAKRTKL
jgi:hypothetical protein